jgi:multidrug resistance efflux pump
MPTRRPLARILTLWLIAMSAGAWKVGGASAQATSSSGDLVIENCFVLIFDDIDVPALEAGPLMELKVREGQYVEKGGELAKLDDRIALARQDTAQAKLIAAQVRAGDDVEIRYAEASYNLASKEEDINRDLAAKKAIPLYEYERSRLATKQAELQKERAGHDLQIAAEDAKVAEYALQTEKEILARHTIRAPISGDVLQIYRRRGEWVNAGDKVMRMVRMDRLRVSGSLAAGRYNPGDVLGRPVTATVTLFNGERKEVTGEIVFVDLEQTAAASGSGSVAIWAEIANQRQGDQWLILAECRAVMTIHMK